MYNRFLHTSITSLRYNLREMNHPLSQGNGPTAFYVTASFWYASYQKGCFLSNEGGGSP